MKVWRLCKKRRASTAFDGEGAKLTGGRWNRIGSPVVYTSANASTAVLETLVHVDRKTFPIDYVLISALIPTNATIRTVVMEELPADWQAYPPPVALQDIGEEWLAANKELILAVPSAVVPDEINYLINPQHPQARKIKITPPVSFSFDSRLF